MSKTSTDRRASRTDERKVETALGRAHVSFSRHLAEEMGQSVTPLSPEAEEIYGRLCVSFDNHYRRISAEMDAEHAAMTSEEVMRSISGPVF